MGNMVNALFLFLESCDDASHRAMEKLFGFVQMAISFSFDNTHTHTHHTQKANDK